jgi:hypothetical protein
MKKLLSILFLEAVVIFSVLSQAVTDYSYKLDNGINVKMDHCWNQVWVQQAYTPKNAADKTPALAVNITSLGDIKSSASFKLLKAGKEVKMQDAIPGTYDLRLTFKLSGEAGVLSFVADNIIIKANTKTAVSVTLYDYQILMDEIPTPGNGMTSYESTVNRSKTNTTQDLYFGVPTFYTKGKHDQAITPDEATSNTKGKIKSGTYDVLITIGISGQSQKVWLENFTMKPDIKYKIAINLNAGGIIYTGGNKDVKAIHLFPAGTAAKQTGAPAPVKNLEIIKYDNPNVLNCCSPGSYDVLLNYKNGAKYEWKKNIAVSSGTKAEVK